jgi:hypothetical protein
MQNPKPGRKVWWIIALVAVAVLIALGLLAAWLYQDLMLQYD